MGSKTTPKLLGVGGRTARPVKLSAHLQAQSEAVLLGAFLDAPLRRQPSFDHCEADDPEVWPCAYDAVAWMIGVGLGI
jgi:hypothetical protein